MIISLYAGGMTIRDIQHHLVSTIGTDLSHETISKITDQVAEEVLAWQTRPLEARRFLLVVANCLFHPASHELCRGAVFEREPGPGVELCGYVV